MYVLLMIVVEVLAASGAALVRVQRCGVALLM